MATPPPRDPAHTAAGGFHTTHWSVVVSAQGAASPEADQALERLCRAYWQPIYLFIRRRGQTPENAQDLTQEFPETYKER